ncbi:hypothetical protein AG1IA_01655 [Rhizoctonia solani AG-1 IA]|uniref:Uncharacterized protein n=1 Tax=Thanatephorus cucumeris (strain AG1-IA) TaxID=983506 RepID=L8X285_THACA|nr:hypothetical protein AG1IA_01655 [Rhizoctonia solani AG-1 IA]
MPHGGEETVLAIACIIRAHATSFSDRRTELGLERSATTLHIFYQEKRARRDPRFDRILFSLVAVFDTLPVPNSPKWKATGGADDLLVRGKFRWFLTNVGMGWCEQCGVKELVS